MIDIRALRDDPDAVKAALARRGVEAAEVDAVIEADVAHRARVAAAEAMRAEVKELSRQVGQAKKAGDDARADELSARSRALGEDERGAAAEVDALWESVRTGLLYLPNIPAEDAPDGTGEEDNVEVRRWWPGQDLGRPEPEGLDHQRVPHWEIGEALQILDMERGARLAGSMFPLYRGPGARLLRALTAFAIDRHSPAYEEIRPPTVVLTDTMTSTGHLPKFADDAYHVDARRPVADPDRRGAADVHAPGRDPRGVAAAAALHRGDGVLPARGGLGGARHPGPAAGARVRQGGAVRLHDARGRARRAGRHLAAGRVDAPGARAALPGRSTCARGDLGGSSARTFDLEAYAPGVDRWLEVSSVSWFRDYQARRANVRFRPAGGGPLQLVHTVNGSALAWPRIWAALVENGRQEDGTVVLPEAWRRISAASS